jgi:hypothetical protein
MKRDLALRVSGERSDSGNAMIIALLVLFLLTTLGISYVAVTKGDKQIAGNQMTSAQAFSFAESGISEALLRMSDPNASPPGTYIGETPPTVTPGWGIYVVNDPGNSGLDPQYNATLTDGLNNDLDASTDESSEHYSETGSKQFTLALANRLDYPWVKVRYKLDGANQVLLFGDHDSNPTTPPRENLAKGVPELIVTAAGRRGVGAKTVTVEAIKWPLPPVPGSVYTEGAMNFNGNAFYVDGHDHDYSAPYDTIAGASPLPGIATPNNPTTIADGLTSGQDDNVQGSGGDPSVRSSSVNLDLAAIAAQWSQIANVTYNGDQNNPSTSGWGTITDLKVVHVAGNLDVSGNNSGSGVLVVDGDFDMGGTFNYNGIVIVLGDLKIAGGGDAKQVIGGIMVQGTVSGTSTMDGNVKLLYSSAMINQLYSLTKYEISSWIDQ